MLYLSSFIKLVSFRDLSGLSNFHLDFISKASPFSSNSELFLSFHHSSLVLITKMTFLDESSRVNPQNPSKQGQVYHINTS